MIFGTRLQKGLIENMVLKKPTIVIMRYQDIVLFCSKSCCQFQHRLIYKYDYIRNQVLLILSFVLENIPKYLRAMLAKYFFTNSDVFIDSYKTTNIDRQIRQTKLIVYKK